MRAIDFRALLWYNEIMIDTPPYIIRSKDRRRNKLLEEIFCHYEEVLKNNTKDGHLPPPTVDESLDLVRRFVVPNRRSNGHIRLSGEDLSKDSIIVEAAKPNEIICITDPDTLRPTPMQQNRIDSFFLANDVPRAIKDRIFSKLAQGALLSGIMTNGTYGFTNALTDTVTLGDSQKAKVIGRPLIVLNMGHLVAGHRRRWTNSLDTVSITTLHHESIHARDCEGLPVRLGEQSSNERNEVLPYLNAAFLLYEIGRQQRKAGSTPHLGTRALVSLLRDTKGLYKYTRHVLDRYTPDLYHLDVTYLAQLLDPFDINNPNSQPLTEESLHLLLQPQ